MYQLRDALIQAFMTRMQGVDHTAASYAADVVLQVLQQQGIPLQAPHQGASPSSMPGSIAGKSGPMGGVPAHKQAPMAAKTPSYDKAGFDKAGFDKAGHHGGKAAPTVDKGGFAKDASFASSGKGAPPMDKGGFPDKGGFKK